MENRIKHIEIRFRDIDQLGHVNNAVYLTYLEQSRIKYFDGLNLSNLNWTTLGVILARTEIDYIIPVLMKDHLEIEISCDRVGSKSFDLSYRFYKVVDSTQITVARAKTVMVCFNFENNVSVEIPNEWKKKLNN